MDKVYRDSIDLKKGEVVAAHNPVTGRTRIKRDRPNNIPNSKSIHELKKFAKYNTALWPLLSTLLCHEEKSIITDMIAMSEYGTNSLKPLSDETTVKDLADKFKVGKNQVTKYFKHLFELGVYSQSRISIEGTKDYWELNPYISFKGKLIEDSMFLKFKDTIVGKMARSL